MSAHRTTDTTYGAAYWDSLDGGAGYHDSVMWADIAHALWEVFVVDREAGVDRSGEHKMLDVGCAFGFLLRHMRARGVEAWGVDFSDYALDHAPDDIAPWLRRLDLRSGNDTFFGPEQFSLVSTFETLEHIAEGSVDNALGTIARALRPGGVVAATICVEGQPGWETDPTHVTIRPAAWWSRRLAAVGLVEDPAAAAELRRFWLFSAHRGVFVARRPPA